MTTSPTSQDQDNKTNLQVWLKYIALGFGIASMGVVLALVLYALSRN